MKLFFRVVLNVFRFVAITVAVNFMSNPRHFVKFYCWQFTVVVVDVQSFGELSPAQTRAMGKVV